MVADRSISQTEDSNPRRRPPLDNGGDIEIGFYSRALHKAAKNLIASLNLHPRPKPAWDACPVVLLCREVVELHLKALVDEGSNFLNERMDSITLYKTHTLRWLTQIIGQIIKAVRWENEFKCEGVASLADFTALVSELSVSHESIANTLAHIYFGDAIWISQIADPGYPVPPHEALPSLDFVVEEWPRLRAKWEAWANAVTDSPVRFPSNHGLSATPDFLPGRS